MLHHAPVHDAVRIIFTWTVYPGWCIVLDVCHINLHVGQKVYVLVSSYFYMFYVSPP